MRFGEYAVAKLSRADTVIPGSGSPHDASHLPSLHVSRRMWKLLFIAVRRFYKANIQLIITISSVLFSPIQYNNGNRAPHVI